MATLAQEQQWLRQTESDQAPLMFSRAILTFAAVATAIIMIAGIIGNALTIFAFWKTQRGNNVTTVFIVCLCAADLLFCLTVLPFNVVRFTVGSSKEEGLTCKLLPFLQYGNVGVSLLFIAMITINRYIMIAHYHAYTKIYRTPFIVAMILFCWMFSFGMQIPTLLGKWGTYAYDKRLLSCTILPDSNGRTAKSALFFVGFVIPCLVIIFCYTRIYMVVRSSDSRMRKHAASNSKLSRKEQKEVKMKRNEWRITKMVLAIFLSFLVCYLPITIIKIADNKVQYPSYHILAYLLLYLSACINPIIYVIMNKQYRQAYKSVLTCHRPKLLSLRRGNTSIADYKDKITSKLSRMRKPYQFWQSISLVGDYKKLQQNTLDVGHQIKSPVAKYPLPPKNVTKGKQFGPQVKPDALEQQPKPNFPELNTPELKNQGLDFKPRAPPTPEIRTRILAGIEVDDVQLKSIKNKLLTDSLTTETEQKIIDFILADDGVIKEEEFRDLSRRLRADLLLMYRADLYYGRRPDFEELVSQETNIGMRTGTRPETGKSTETKNTTETEKGVRKKIIKGDTIFEPYCDDSKIKSKESEGWWGYGDGQSGPFKVRESFERGGSNNLETRTLNTNSGVKCEPRNMESLTPRHSANDKRSKVQQNSDITCSTQKFEVTGRKMILCERPDNAEADVHTFQSVSTSCTKEPEDWIGFGGNWVGLDFDGHRDTENSGSKQVGYGAMQGFMKKETTTYEHPEQLNSVLSSDVNRDDATQEPLNWQGFGNTQTDPKETHHRNVCNPKSTSLQNNTKYRFPETVKNFYEERSSYPGYIAVNTSERIPASTPSYLNTKAESRIKVCQDETRILNSKGFSATTPRVLDDPEKFLSYAGTVGKILVTEDSKNLNKCQLEAPGFFNDSYKAIMNPDSAAGPRVLRRGRPFLRTDPGVSEISTRSQCYRLNGNPCDSKPRQLLTADPTPSAKKKPSTQVPGSRIFEGSDDPSAFPYEDLNVMMHSLMFKFQDLPRPLAKKPLEVESFLQFCAARMTPDICAKIEVETRDQSENSLWFKLKFGRITASILYSVAQCRTPSGYLVKSIIGLRTWFCGNDATIRGRRLETEVAELVGNRMKTKFHRCGLFLSGTHPILGASPDAINDTYVMEIKSPYKPKSYGDYLGDGYKVGKKYMAQIQLQMFMTGRKVGLFCVAAPDFETSRRVEVITVEYDKELIEGLIQRATKFWKANIYPLLTEIKREADRPPPDYWPL